MPAVECPWIPQKHLDEVKKRMGDIWYRQEYCCEFGDSDDVLLSSKVLEEMWSEEWEDLGI